MYSYTPGSGQRDSYDDHLNGQMIKPRKYHYEKVVDLKVAQRKQYNMDKTARILEAEKQARIKSAISRTVMAKHDAQITEMMEQKELDLFDLLVERLQKKLTA